MQTTKQAQWGDLPLLAITNPTMPFTIVSSPGASDGWGEDSQGGTHHVVARNSANQIVYGLTNMDSNVMP